LIRQRNAKAAQLKERLRIKAEKLAAIEALNKAKRQRELAKSAADIKAAEAGEAAALALVEKARLEKIRLRREEKRLRKEKREEAQNLKSA